MECGDHKVSAERCLFLMLLNEDGLDENKRKSGKDRLTAAWEFKGERTAVRAGRGEAAQTAVTRHPSTGSFKCSSLCFLVGLVGQADAVRNVYHTRG